MTAVQGIAMVDGVRIPLADAALSLTDEGVARGDGAFETVGVWDGRAFRLDDHLRRLARSLDAVALPPPDIDRIADEARQLLGERTGDGALRIFVTASATRIVTLAPPPQRPEPRRLDPQPAPWIRPLGSYAPAGAKTMSYLPNMAATRMAQRRGADDALLIALEGWVLEGPTFAVYWVADGDLYAVPTELGIVDSISRLTVLEIADAEGVTTVVEPRPLDHLLEADEVMISSAVRPLLPISAVGGHDLPGATPVRARLAAALDQRRRSR